MVMPVFASIVWLSGCSNVSLQQNVRQSSSAVDTVLSRDELGIHLTFFNGQALGGRATGTRGFVFTSAYVSARLNEYGLQPLIPHEFRSLYGTPLHYPITVEFIQYAPDTLRLETGVDFYPDGRTNAGSIRFRSVLWNPDVGTDLSDEVVWIPGDGEADDVLLRLAQRGAQAILIEGPISVRLYDRPISRAQIVRISPLARRILLTTGPLAPGRVQLPFEVELITTVQVMPIGSGQNMSGMVLGANPVLRKELVVVAARLDGFGAVNGVALTDGTDLAVGASALLETARVVAGIQDRIGPYGRTILFAFWSGSLSSHSGMRAFLKHPPWARSAIHSLIYVADAGESTEEVSRLAGDYGMKIHVIGSPPLWIPADFARRAEVFSSYLDGEAVNAALDTARRTLVVLEGAAGERSGI